eukprot:14084292-Ditylum_brightwellii.AAC.1
MTCTLDANGGMAGLSGLVGVTKSAPAKVWYEAGVIVNPSIPSIFAMLTTTCVAPFGNVC